MEYQVNKITNIKIDEIALNSDFSMNSLCISIPYTYTKQLANLNWQDVKFAIENGFLPCQSAIEHAISIMENNRDYSEVVLELAGVSMEKADIYSILCYVNKLAEDEPEEKKNESKDKMLFILLSWIYEHRNCYEDPLRVVEFVYDDFDFPTSIEKFVRYMPIDEPLLGTLEANVNRLYSRWESFLREQQLRFS